MSFSDLLLLHCWVEVSPNYMFFALYRTILYATESEWYYFFADASANLSTRKCMYDSVPEISASSAVRNRDDERDCIDYKTPAETDTLWQIA